VARLVAVDVARARDEDEACRAADGSTVAAFGHPLRCPNSAAGLEHAGGVAAWATHLGEAVLLDGLDRWYRLGPAGAGFCHSCELALVEALRESYGDHFESFDPLGPQRAQHVHKNVGRRRGNAGARGHGPLPRHGVIGAKDERHGIDEINRRFGRIARHETYKKSVASCGYLRCRDAA